MAVVGVKRAKKGYSTYSVWWLNLQHPKLIITQVKDITYGYHQNDDTYDDLILIL
jgi:hypothetical protein